MILLVIYWVLGFWAAGRTIYANKVVVYTGSVFFCRKAAIGLFFGWALIPWSLIKLIFGRR